MGLRVRFDYRKACRRIVDVRKQYLIADMWLVEVGSVYFAFRIQYRIFRFDSCKVFRKVVEVRIIRFVYFKSKKGQRGGLKIEESVLTTSRHEVEIWRVRFDYRIVRCRFWNF